MNKKTSIKDIAQYVGVSTALVSYVLNGKEKEARVGEEVAKKIRTAAVKLNYQPNFIAKSLKSGKTNTIGFIAADISNPFFSNLARIVEDEAKKYGCTVIFGSSDEQADKSQDLIHTLLNRQVDGLIIAPAANTEDQINRLLKQKVPFVLIDRFFPDLKAASICTNNYDAAYTATTHLLNNGYKKIGMLSHDTTLVHMNDRVRGYQDALKAKKIKTKKDWLHPIRYHSYQQDITNAIKKMLNDEREVEAFVFATNSLAVESLKQINALGIKVPEELGLVSFDETDAFDLFYAPLTFIKQDIQQMGKEAVRLLLDEKTNNKKASTQLVVEAELIVRSSTQKNR